MTRIQLTAALLSLPLVLAACVNTAQPTVPAGAEVSRLQSMGYRVTARSASGATNVLRYSGPINASVRCGTGSGSMRTMAPRSRSASGGVQDFRLNTYLVLAAGSDGALSARERDGLYVVSRITRPSAGARATEIESIAFEPGKRGAFASGLACEAS